MAIRDLSRRLRDRSISPVELTTDCLARIAKHNPALNAYITVDEESALAQARAAEQEIASGIWRGPLHGIPMGLKDLIDTDGIKTTAASALFKDHFPTQDAEVTRRLKDAGAVLLGKQNLHEFAYGGSSLVSHYGDVHNPWSPAHITGGSSGGSAASVAAELDYGSIGTDTAGSVREPAAQCGVVGLKPTYGRVSARGVVPLSWSLDHVGPITRTVEDAAMILQTIAGYDPHDVNSASVRVTDYVSGIRNDTKSLRLGIPKNFFFEDLAPEVDSAVAEALNVLKTMTAATREVDLPVSMDRTVQAAESYAYHKQFLKDSSELYQPETLRRILTGADITAAVYIAAKRELEQSRRDICKVFADIDVIITPTTPVAAPSIAELKEHPDRLRPREILLLRNTRPINLWGLPAISVPCGFTDRGLPIGLQIVGPHWEEARVLRLAFAYEQATAWHHRKPALVREDATMPVHEKK